MRDVPINRMRKMETQEFLLKYAGVYKDEQEEDDRLYVYPVKSDEGDIMVKVYVIKNYITAFEKRIGYSKEKLGYKIPSWILYWILRTEK